MSSFDGAETCELVGLYILSQLVPLAINVGLYREDGLAVSSKTPRQTEVIKKEICKIFQNNNLKISIQANQKCTSFLDITMSLTTGEYKPYMKQNNTPLYIHKDSNHPPSIIKNIPESINKRLSSISSNERTFNQAAHKYQQALKKGGYTYTLTYKPERDSATNMKHNRKRNIT